jgi:hypothetical protein
MGESLTDDKDKACVLRRETAYGGLLGACDGVVMRGHGGSLPEHLELRVGLDLGLVAGCIKDCVVSSTPRARSLTMSVPLED